MTVLTKIEKILNNRPLSYHPDEVLRPLITPNCFLLPGRTANVDEMLEMNENALESKCEELTGILKRAHGVLEHFWSMFWSQYLLSLRERQNVNHPVKKNSLPFVPRKGEVVLVKEPSAPRAEWKLGVILSIGKGQRVATPFGARIKPQFGQ